MGAGDATLGPGRGRRGSGVAASVLTRAENPDGLLFLKTV